MDKSTRKLQNIREEIDALDKMILKTLRKRFKLVGKVAAIKKKLKLPLHQKTRWESMLKTRLKLAPSLGIAKPFTVTLFKLIHSESKRLQSIKMKKDKK